MHANSLLTAMVTASCLCSSSAAQSTAVVLPNAYAAQEAPESAFWALAPYASRRQLVIPAASLTPLRGKRIDALAVRRNAAVAESTEAGKLRIGIWLSHAARDAGSASPRFVDNRGRTPSLAFNAIVDLPRVAPPTGSPAPWRAPHAVFFGFRRGFAYLGGSLCIETVTTVVGGNNRNSNGGPWWQIDAVAQDLGGVSTRIGKSCIPGSGPQPAGAVAATLAGGESAAFFLRSSLRSGPVVFALGRSDKRLSGLPLPLGLGPFGAPNCTIYNDVVTTWSTVPKQLSQTRLGLAVTLLDIPFDRGFAGATVFGQWYSLSQTANRLGLIASNGVRATLGATVPRSAIAWVEGDTASATRGILLRGRVPVLRLEAN